MQHAPTETANASYALVVNLLDFLVETEVLTRRERVTVINNAEGDLGKSQTTENKDALRVLGELKRVRYKLVR